MFIVDYTYDDLEQNGDLKNIQEPKPVPYLAYNFPEIMKWDGNIQTVGHSGTKNTEDSDHLKTVFIVNVEELISFLGALLQR